MIHSSTAASAATIKPTITCTDMAVVAWKPISQGDTTTHSPTMKLSHSSQIAKFVSAAIDSTAITTPLIMAFWRWRTCVECEQPGRDEQERTQHQIGNVTILGIGPLVHDIPPSMAALGRNRAAQRPLKKARNAC